MYDETSSDQPRPEQRGRDCLIDLLLDFWLLDLNTLELEEIRRWLGTVALCLCSLFKADTRHPERPLHAARWLDIVVTRVSEEFPSYPGGPDQIREDLRVLMLEQIEP
jgi:hypothetical protein